MGMQPRVPILKDLILQHLNDGTWYKNEKELSMLYSDLATRLESANACYNDPKLANFGMFQGKMVIIDFVDSVGSVKDGTCSSMATLQEQLEPYMQYYNTYGNF